MNALLNPAISLLNKFKVQQKLLLIAAVFLLVLGLLTFLLFQQLQHDLDFSRKESVTSSMIAPARLALQAVQEHRGLSQGIIGGNNEMVSKQQDAKSRADVAFARGDEVLRGDAASPETSEAWKQARAAWEDARGKALSVTTQESFDLHSLAVKKIQTYIESVVDATNASLDPELASYTLMNIFAVHAPLLTEGFGQGRARATSAATHKTTSDAERVNLGVLQQLIRGNVESIKNSIDKVSATNAAYKAVLGDSFRVIEEAGVIFNEQVVSLLRRDEKSSASSSPDASKVFENGTRAVNAAFAIMDEATKAFDKEIRARIMRIEQERNLLIAVLVCGAIVGIYLFLAFRKSMLLALGSIENGSRRMAQGDLSQPVKVDSRDEFGDIAKALNRMRDQLHERIEGEAEIAAENLRVRNALDKSSTNIMLADNDGVIVYCNESVLAMLAVAESDIRKALPNFRAQSLVGRNFDDFHANPAHQRNILSRLTGIHRSQIEVGGRYFRLTANPVINERNERLGSVVEWLDRTAEVRAEREINELVQAASAGNFTARISLEGKSGFFLQMSEGINGLVDVVARGLEDVAKVLNSMAQGDLTSKIDAQYLGTFGQLKDNTNATVDRLKEVIGQIKEATDAVAGAAQEIAAGNTDLSARTEEQASSLEQTSSSMEELNSTVRQNAENAIRANDLARESNESAQRGGEMVRHVVEMMSSIQGSSRKIADIIGVIDSIAFQTNILALNAAVEAARAGEQGRGFAVVASEVRSLAQRSAQAAKEIKTLIADSVEKVDSGAKLVNDTGKTMTEVVDNFVSLAHIVTEISQASREQSAGIEQVAGAINQMDEVTQQNAALVEQAAAAAESLEEQARTLTEVVAMFNTGVATVGQRGAKVKASVRSMVSGPVGQSGVRRIAAKQVSLPVIKSKLSQPVARGVADEDEWEEF